MSSLQTIKDAIESKKSISFEYNKEGKVRGKRIGDPYVLYILSTESGGTSTKVDVFQTDGVSDTNPPKFPDFRTFDMEELLNVEILDENVILPLSEKYNPNSNRYDNVIAKI